MRGQVETAGCEGGTVKGTQRAAKLTARASRHVNHDPLGLPSRPMPRKLRDKALAMTVRKARRAGARRG